MLPVLRRNGWTDAPQRFESFASRVFEDMDRAFADLDRAFAGFGTMTRGTLPVALWEDENAYYVEAEVPGVAESDIEATVQDGLLTLRVERKAEQDRSYLYNSRSFGKIERIFTLPDAVDTDEVQAQLKDGILRLTLPKTPAARPKRITIQSN